MAPTTAERFARRLALVRAQLGTGATGPVPLTRQPSPWMSTADLADYLRLTARRRPLEAARDWARRHGLVAVLRNGELLFARRDVERALAADDERQARGAAAAEAVRARRRGRVVNGTAEDAQKGRIR